MRVQFDISLRSGALALVLAVVPFAPALAQLVVNMPAAAQSAAPQKRAMALAVGDALRLEKLSLDDSGQKTATAELRRITATAPQTRYTVHTGNQSVDISPPVRAHFAGQLAGEAGSSVFVSVDEDGAMRSIIDRGGEVVVSEVIPASAQRPALASVRRIAQSQAATVRPFSCGVTPEFIAQSTAPVDTELRKALNAAPLGTAINRAAALGVQRRADIIIETDYELFQRMGGSSQTAAYITDLFAYLNTRYQTEISTRLNLTQINMYATASDPWTRTSSSDQLADLLAYWNTAPRSAQPRHHVHLLSAKDGGGGVAYLATLNVPTYAYGVSTGIEGGFSAANPQIVWDAVEVAHEIGHAFGSTHTHNYDNPYIGSKVGGAIDCCYSEAAGSQCAIQNGGGGRSGTFPGVGSITGGAGGQRTGTIMSYCHVISPGMSNISFSFGTNHPNGVNPVRVADVMSASSQSYLPVDNVATYLLSVSPSGTGTGSVTSTPSGIQCGSDCTEAYTSGTTVTLTATPAAGSIFGGWSGACSGSASTCSVNMGNALSVGAVFTVGGVNTLSVSRSGSGVVTSSTGGINCGTTCSANYASGSNVTLTATADAGASFLGWGGTCAGTATSCAIAMTSARTVSATFSVANSAPVCTLSASPSTIAPGGVATLNANCSPTATSYTWQGGTCAGTAGSSCTVSPSATTTYSVAGTNTNGTGTPALATVAVSAGGSDFPPGGVMPSGWVQPAGSAAPWYVTTDTSFGGIYSIRAGQIGDDQASRLSYTASFNAGTVSFARRVSSESNFDLFRFYIDGVQQTQASGEIAWGVVSYPLSAGTHTLMWEYAKDGSVGRGSDTVWIDDFTVSTNAAPVVCNTPPSVSQPSQTLNGTNNNDFIYTTAGNDSINGYAGVDTVMYTCSRASFSLAKTAQGWALSSLAEGLDTLTNMERIRFSERTLALDIDGNAGKVYRTYQAAFNRVPDNGGLKYWITVMDSGASLDAISGGFVTSDEFRAVYGANPTDAQYVTRLYDNVLHRAPEQSGFDFWVSILARGAMTRAQVLAAFAESAENKAGVLSAISNGINLLD